MRDYLINFGSINWENPAPGVSHKVYIFDGMKIRLLEFDDEFFEKEWCLKGHVGYVLEGSLSIDFSGELVEFKHGDGLFIPEGTRHKAKIDKGEKALLIMFEKA